MKINELDIDFIGDQTSLTIEEEKLLNDYFRRKKTSLKLNKEKNINKKLN